MSALFDETKFTSHAVGMAVAQPLDFEINCARNPIFGSAAWFFIITLKFIFTPIFEIKIYEKNSLTPKKIHFRSLIFRPHSGQTASLGNTWYPISIPAKNFGIMSNFNLSSLMSLSNYNFVIFFKVLNKN